MEGTPAIDKIEDKIEDKRGTYGRFIGQGYDYHFQYIEWTSKLVIDMLIDKKQYKAEIPMVPNLSIAIVDTMLTELNEFPIDIGCTIPVTLNYSTNFHLNPINFNLIHPLDLYHLIFNMGNNADLVIIYGELISDNVIKNIHYNYPIENSDGAIGFYFRSINPHIQWILINP